jgi:RNA polymerase sigma-70 factor, ECF subfamily
LCFGAHGAHRIILRFARGVVARTGRASMELSQRDELERAIRRDRDEGELQRAAATAIQGYGPEIFGFLVALHRDEQDASEVFSLFTERLWRGLPGFDWQCSFRTWAYVIARNVSVSYRRETRRRARRQIPLSALPELSAIEQKVRSQTVSYLRTQRKTRVAALRQTLSVEDQALLVLRVDRRLAWNDLARVMQGEDGPPLGPEVMKREVARLRKRFQLVKEKLHELGRREGLIGPDRGG